MPTNNQTTVSRVSGEKDSASSSLFRFAETAEQVGATTKRLEKAAILAGYFSLLPDEALNLAARYFAGYAFPLRDQRRTNVGGAALFGAILKVSGADETRARERLVALGDMGDLAGEMFTQSPQQATVTNGLT